MFHFGKKKASVPELVLSAENIELYRGPLSDIPLSEKTILATCMDLYKDPQPCYIHRGAARQYLVAKLTDMITNGTPDFARPPVYQLCRQAHRWVSESGLDKR